MGFIFNSGKNKTDFVISLLMSENHEVAYHGRRIFVCLNCLFLCVFLGKHFVELEAKLIVAALVSRYEVHLDGKSGLRPDPFDVTSFAKIQIKMAKRNMRDREFPLEASLNAFHKSNKKYLFF